MSRERILTPNGAPPVVWAIASVFVLFELAFQLAEAGVLPFPDLRWQVYLRLAFFDVFFEGVMRGASVPSVFWSSLVSHAFLHGGPLHLFMNGAIFLALGGVLARSLGSVRFIALCLVTAIGGAVVFGLLADVQGPLVGASGVLFGFFGALKRWEWRWLAATGQSKRRFWGSVLGLAAINVLLFFAYQGGVVAWEAHLGGFVTGWLIAPILAPGRAGPSPF